jgi:hypothetical protein
MKLETLVRSAARPWVYQWTLRIAEIGIATVLILMLYQIQEAVFRNIGTQLWFRTDVPVVYALDTGCSGDSGRLSYSSLQNGQPRLACSSTATVFVVSKGKPGTTYLFLNGAYSSQVSNSGGNVVFRDVPLRWGLNSIEVFTELEGHFPFVTTRFPPSLRPEQESFYYNSTDGFIGRDRNLPNHVWLRLDPPLERPGAVTTSADLNDPSRARLLGSYLAHNSMLWLVFQGIPGLGLDPVALTTRHPGDAPSTGSSGKSTFGDDGYYLVPAAGFQMAPEPESPKARLPRRSLTLGFLDGDRLSVNGSACLEKDHPFVHWAATGDMRAPEFILRIFNVVVFTEADNVGPRSDPWSSPFHLNVEEGADCTTVSGDFSLDHGTAFSSGVTLPDEQDTLSISRSEGRLKIAGRRPREGDGNTKVWNGLPQVFTATRLELSPVSWDSSPTPVVHGIPDSDTSPFGAWKRLVATLPGVLNLSTTAALPIFLILVALRKERYPAEFRETLTGPRAALVGVLAFVCVFALEPVIGAVMRLILALGSIKDLTRVESYRQSYFVPGPLALIAVFSITPLLTSTRTQGPAGPTARFMRHRLVAAAITVLAVAMGVLILTALRLMPAPIPLADLHDKASWLELQVGGLLTGSPTSLWTYELLVAAWFGVCLLALPFSVFWLMRVLTPQVSIVRAAIACSALIFLLPAFGWLSDFIALRMLPPMALSLQENHLSQAHPGVFSALQHADLAAPIIAFLAVVALLTAFRNVLSSMLAPPLALQLRARVGFWPIALAGCLIVGTIIPGGSNSEVNPAIETFDLLWHFQSYAPLLALVAVASVASAYAHMLATTGATAFERSEPMDALIEAVFVGYLAIVWSDDAAGVVIVAFAGWLSIHYLVMDRSPGAVTAARSPELASRLVKYIERVRLLEQRRTAIEKKYASGKLETEKYESTAHELQALRERAASDLGVTEAAAKRAIFELGPASTPLANANVGAITGLIAAVLVLLFSRLDLFGQMGKGQIVHALSAIFRGGQHSEFPFGEPPNTPILLFLQSLLQAVGPLAIAGGLFGYSFHRIRGRDGFTKALMFSAGCAIPFLVAMAMESKGLPQGVQPLLMLAPFALFLVILGSLVFDGWTLHRLNVGFDKLIDLYGLKTAVGYASVAGAIAGVQPLLFAVGYLFPGKN